jgi:hypothetical protein
MKEPPNELRRHSYCRSRNRRHRGHLRTGRKERGSSRCPIFPSNRATEADERGHRSGSAAKYYDPTTKLSDEQICDLVLIGTSAPTSFHLKYQRLADKWLRGERFRRANRIDSRKLHASYRGSLS